MTHEEDDKKRHEQRVRFGLSCPDNILGDHDCDDGYRSRADSTSSTSSTSSTNSTSSTIISTSGSTGTASTTSVGTSQPLAKRASRAVESGGRKGSTGAMGAMGRTKKRGFQRKNGMWEARYRPTTKLSLDHSLHKELAQAYRGSGRASDVRTQAYKRKLSLHK